jgi:hypothetical protein
MFQPTAGTVMLFWSDLSQYISAVASEALLFVFDSEQVVLSHFGLLCEWDESLGPDTDSLYFALVVALVFSGIATILIN